MESSIVISLDFELHWGRFDKYDIKSSQLYYMNAIEYVPHILELFDKYEIHASWATVGMLMAENWEEWNTYQPDSLPEFKDQNLSAYHWAMQNNKKSAPGTFAPELVKSIISCANQELASHTFSHFYTGEKGASTQTFTSDLAAAKKIAKDKFKKKLTSLVFPRNQYSNPYLEVARASGFEVVRTNPKDWFWNDIAYETLSKKIFRTADTLFPMGNKTSYTIEQSTHDNFLELPASRLLRPYSKGSIFNKRRIDRIKSEIESAISLGEVYHLWWHPHNFGYYPAENLEVLAQLLKFINKLVKEGKLQSLTMGEAGKKYSAYDMEATRKSITSLK